MSARLRIAALIAALLVTLAIGSLLALRATTMHPAPQEPVAVTCRQDASPLKPGQPLKVLSWNVQYMASKNYVFYYDTFEGDGPDERPSAAHIAWTLDQVARVLLDEDPDVILVQEIDQGAKRTDMADQVALLHAKIGQRYPCHASTFYWKAAHVPHPRIRGAVGMKLATWSKTLMRDPGQRLALPMYKQGWLTDHFYLKRAIQRHELPIQGKDVPLVVMNTHLDAFAQGSDTMERQVKAVQGVLAALQAQGSPWLIGGDFNLLATPSAYERLGPLERRYFNPQTELRWIDPSYQLMPSREQLDGPEHARWFTHFPNDPRVKAPDRTIDYVIASPSLRVLTHQVRQHDTLDISDHLPVVVTLQVP